MSEEGSVRTTISLPKELKREMDGVKESVNWSNVAAEAFRRKLLELQSSRKGKKMEDVVKRLKAAAELEANEEYEAGKEAGRQWASDEAKPSQLRFLDENYNPQVGLQGFPDAFGWGGVVYCQIHKKRFSDRSELNGFWKTTLDEDDEMIHDESFAEGFLDGALEVWHAVEEQI